MPDIGHNSDLTEDQRKALFFHHLGTIASKKEKAASASGELRAAYKAAKADSFTKKDIDFALSLEKDEDEKMVEQRKREIEIAAWCGHPIGTQADLFDGVDRTPIVERAAAEGRKAGAEGQSSSANPYDGEAGQVWMREWHAGQKDLHDAFLALNRNKDALVKTERPRGAGDDFDDLEGVDAEGTA